jgi:hypothetical protein
MSYFELDGSKLTKDELKRRLGFIDQSLVTREQTRKYYLELYSEIIKTSEFKKKIVNKLNSEKKELEEDYYYLRSLCKKRDRGHHYVDLNTPDFSKRRETTNKKQKKFNLATIFEEEGCQHEGHDLKDIIIEKQMNIDTLYNKIEMDLKDHKEKYNFISSGKKSIPSDHKDYSFRKPIESGKKRIIFEENDRGTPTEVMNPLVSVNTFGNFESSIRISDLNSTINLNETIYIEEQPKKAANVSTVSISRNVGGTPKIESSNFTFNNNDAINQSAQSSKSSYLVTSSHKITKSEQFKSNAQPSVTYDNEYIKDSYNDYGEFNKDDYKEINNYNNYSNKSYYSSNKESQAINNSQISNKSNQDINSYNRALSNLSNQGVSNYNKSNKGVATYNNNKSSQEDNAYNNNKSSQEVNAYNNKSSQEVNAYNNNKSSQEVNTYNNNKSSQEVNMYNNNKSSQELSNYGKSSQEISTYNKSNQELNSYNKGINVNALNNSKEFKTLVNDIKIASTREFKHQSPIPCLSPRAANRLLVEFVTSTSQFNISDSDKKLIQNSSKSNKLVKYLPIILGTGFCCLLIQKVDFVKIDEMTILVSLAVGIIFALLLRWMSKRNYRHIAEEDLITVLQLIKYNQLKKVPVGIFESSLIKDLALRHCLAETKYAKHVFPILKELASEYITVHDVIIQNQLQKVWRESAE